MKYRGACQKYYSLIAPWVTSAAVCLIAAERAYVFAESTKPDPTVPLGELEQRKNSNFKNKEEACRALDGKILTYYDQTTYVKNCKQHLIEDVEVLNALSKLPGKTINEVPAKVYRLIPFGEPFTEKDLAALTNQKQATGVPKNCFNLNGEYITVTGSTYYWVDNCKKHEFADRFSFEQHNRKLKPITTVNEDVLARIPRGPAIKIDRGELGILYKLDGDTQWSKLYRNRGSEAALQDSPESLTKIDEATRKVNKPELCKKINNKVVSNYSQMYFVDDCTIRPIKDYSSSIVFQARIDEVGGVLDLTPEQVRSLNQGKEIEVADVLKRLR